MMSKDSGFEKNSEEVQPPQLGFGFGTASESFLFKNPADEDYFVSKFDLLDLDDQIPVELLEAPWGSIEGGTIDETFVKESEYIEDQLSTTSDNHSANSSSTNGRGRPK